jgi:hypothetical protein
MNSMRIVLQHKVSLEYLKDDFSWINSFEEAKSFGTSLQAMDFSRSHKLTETQVVLKFEDPQYDIVLPTAAVPGTPPSNRKTI